MYLRGSCNNYFDEQFGHLVLIVTVRVTMLNCSFLLTREMSIILITYNELWQFSCKFHERIISISDEALNSHTHFNGTFFPVICTYFNERKQSTFFVKTCLWTEPSWLILLEFCFILFSCSSKQFRRLAVTLRWVCRFPSFDFRSC